MFGRHNDNAPVPAAATEGDATEGDGTLERAANAIARQLITVGIEGIANFDSAQQVAEKALKQTKNPVAAVEHIINSHVRLAGMNGFLTNLGGFVTMPVALPANVVGFYTLATRMVAAIAHINGHNVHSEQVRSAVLLHLIGEDATKVLRGVGGAATVPVRVATAGLPPAALAVVNKAVAFRIAARTGERFLTKIPRIIPVAGGVVGAVVDVMLIKRIAKAASAGFAPSAAASTTTPSA